MKTHPTTARVAIDLTERFGRPLSKERLSIYNSGLVPIERYRRDAHYFAETGAESLRIDLGWGAEWMPWKHQQVEIGPDGSPNYAFEETDELVDLLAGAYTRPYWSYCYVPIAARPEGGDWRTMAESNELWVDMVTAYVSHARSRGDAIGYHEVYNEPDLRDERTGEAVFYSGDLDDYLDLYRQTARAIRSADPDAIVGGPALAFPMQNANWLEHFLEMVRQENLPLDFLSFHHYGTFTLDGSLGPVDKVLEHFDFPYLETHLNEYNSFPIDYPEGGTQDTNLLAAAFAADIPRLLDRPGLTKTSWAQFLDSGEGNFSGMITIGGTEKPIYEVFSFYQRMPLSRRAVRVDGPDGIGAIASSGADGAAVIAWNRHFADLDVELAFAGLDDTEVEVHTIGPAGTALSTHTVVQGRLTLPIPSAGVLLVSAGVMPDAPQARIVERSFRRRPANPRDGWVDVDESSGLIQFGVEADYALLVGGAEFARDTLLGEWTWSIQDGSGRAAEGSLVLREITSSGVQDTVFGSLLAEPFDWDRVAPARLRGEGRRRVLVALVGAAAGTFASLAPVVSE